MEWHLYTILEYSDGLCNNNAHAHDGRFGAEHVGAEQGAAAPPPPPLFRVLLTGDKGAKCSCPHLIPP